MTDDLPDLAQPKPPKGDDRIRGRLKAALDLMVFGAEDGIPLDYAASARSVDYPVRSMRRALERPHVRQYLRQAGQVLRASICARIPHRLGQLMMQDQNMAAAVKAAATLEAIDEREAAKPAGRMAIPGLVVQINVQQPIAPAMPRFVEQDATIPPPAGPAAFGIRPAPPARIDRQIERHQAPTTEPIFKAPSRE